MDVVSRNQERGPPMTPEEAPEEQLRRRREMSGEQRLLIALRLHELACEIAREGIRPQFPETTPEQVAQHLRRRLKLAR